MGGGGCNWWEPRLAKPDSCPTDGDHLNTAGRVATVGSLLDTPPSATTLAQIPINVRYSPTSDESRSRFRLRLNT
jgi:hypothetical protein